MGLHRRDFLKGMGVAGLSGVAAPGLDARGAPQDVARPRGPKTWAFWDLWRVERAENLEHVQGRARWQEDATYSQDDLDGLAAWPTVWRDPASGKWRMLFSLRWLPFTLCLAESEDGRRWTAAAGPDLEPEGGKRAPNQLWTLPNGSGGGVYLDPVARDGFPFKVFCRQHGPPVLARALADPAHRWHAIAKAEGLKKYMSDSLTAVSRDGLRWEARFDLPWSLPDWHPEPPLFGFYHAGLRKHMMTVRPGWGDRRICLQGTDDFTRWSDPELLFQPDALDADLIEHYGMPVFPSGGGYVGLLWIARFDNAEARPGYNKSIGPLDAQLAFSYDGLRFWRGRREPFIALNDPGKPGGGAIEPSFLVEADGELRIYSGSSRYFHGEGGKGKEAGDRRFGAILLHTLRKDGFMFLRSRGATASFISKPFVLFDGGLSVNARAPVGEIRVQITDVDRKPLEGFTFDDAAPFKADDALDRPLQWKGRTLQALHRKVIRLEMKLHQAELYAVRGNFHFLDTQDVRMLEDGKTIDPARFDF